MNYGNKLHRCCISYLKIAFYEEYDCYAMKSALHYWNVSIGLITNKDYNDLRGWNAHTFWMLGLDFDQATIWKSFDRRNGDPKVFDLYMAIEM